MTDVSPPGTVDSTWVERSAAQIASACGAAMQAAEPGDAERLPSDGALDRIAIRFGLSDAERTVLALVAGVECLDDIVGWCREQCGHSHPTVQLLLSVVPGLDWEAFTPGSVLRTSRLIRIGAGASFAESPVHVDEDVLHNLLGHLTLAASALPALTLGPAAAASQIAGVAVDRIVASLQADGPAVFVGGCSVLDAASLAGQVAERLGATPARLDARLLPTDPQQLDDLAALLNREALLHELVLFVENDPGHTTDSGWALARFVERFVGPMVIGGEPPASTTTHFGVVALRPDEVVAADANRQIELDELAQRMGRSASLDDLVLPAESIAQLRSLADRVRLSAKVLDEWGFRAGARGTGVNALFAGPSGTGKTLAAEALATELELPLFRVDLAATISKWIGETEKNLARIFDAAERTQAILLFDEADALFGKRTEVRDSHDRYANIEVSYLLQRIEAYDGLSILTSNMKTSLDHAFARRLTFIIDFPMPGATERERIWEQLLPETAPTDALDVTRLAQLGVAGGNIRNIALAAAFAAAADDSPIEHHHVREAARSEYRKIGRTLSDAELRGWPS